MKQFTLITISILIASLATIAQNIDLKQGLVAYYPFNGNANDESGHGNYGQINGVIFTNDKIGRKKSACYFDGNSYIIVPDNNSLDFTSSFSIFAWVNIEDVNHNQKIISKIDLRRMDGGYILGIDKAQVYPEIFDKWNKKFGGMKGGGNLQSNTWSLIGVTFNNDKVRYYHNDKCISEFPVHPTTLYNNSSNLVIGTNSWENPPTKMFFKGIIDEVRLYNRALNNDEILALYKDQEEVIINLPIVSWERPSIDFINTNQNHFTIRASIKSKKPLTSLQIFENNSLYKNIIDRGNHVVYHGNYDMVLEQKISLLEGINQIKIIASNDDGTVSSEIRTINYQPHQFNNPPVISWENPMNFYSNTNHNFVNIKACIKSKKPLNGLQIFVNDLLSIDLSDREYNYTNLSNRGCDIFLDQQILLREGDNQVKIIASNQAGTTMSDVRTINYQQQTDDIAPPSITLLKPEVLCGFKTTGDCRQMEVIGKATDENGIFEVTVNGMTAQLRYDGMFKSNVSLANGENAITIKATDTKQNTSKFTFYINRSSDPFLND